MLFTKTFTHR